MNIFLECRTARDPRRFDSERRSFHKSAFVAGGGAAAWAASGTLTSPASAQTKPSQPTYHYLPALTMPFSTSRLSRAFTRSAGSEGR